MFKLYIYIVNLFQNKSLALSFVFELFQSNNKNLKFIYYSIILYQLKLNPSFSLRPSRAALRTREPVPQRYARRGRGSSHALPLGKSPIHRIFQTQGAPGLHPCIPSTRCQSPGCQPELPHQDSQSPDEDQWGEY